MWTGAWELTGMWDWDLGVDWNVDWSLRVDWNVGLGPGS